MTSHVDAARFRNALAALPAGVVVVTSVGASGELVGATVSAFMSLSIDPPLVLLSLAADTRTADAIRASGAFAAHIVGERNQELALGFAARGGDKFAGVDYLPNDRGVPILGGFDVAIQCSLRDQHPGGDHIIFVGLVEDITSGHGGAPAVWYDRRFHVLPAANVEASSQKKFA